MTLPIATVGALIFSPDERVLLIRTHKWCDAFGVPGGKIEDGEALEDALVREIREETGLIVGDVRFLLVQESVYSDEFYKPAHFILLNYTCRATGTAVTLNDEAQSAEWVTLDVALTMPLNSFTRVLVERAREERRHGNLA